MKILLPFLILSSLAIADEDAIILNQEMNFLVESARDIRVGPRATEETETLAPESSLERTYFEDSGSDEVRTRAAAPRRARSF